MEKTQHINILELKEVYSILLTFTKETKTTNVHLQIYLSWHIFWRWRELGNLEMIRISKEIWIYLLSRNILITGEYLPSKLNYVADQKSRWKMDCSEWEMSQKIFQKMCRKVVTPEVDWFVSRLSHQLKSTFLEEKIFSIREQMPCNRIDQRKWQMLPLHSQWSKSAEKSPDGPSENNDFNCTNVARTALEPRNFYFWFLTF